ncbi:MAG: IS256 family transposase [Terriglobia bacterium]
MNKTYQINERKAIAEFRSHLTTDAGSIQLILPLASLAQRLRHGVDQMLFEAERELLLLILDDEVAWLTGARYGRGDGRRARRWGQAAGSVVIHGQKVPIQRPRVRGYDGERKLGSYELFRRDEEMQRKIWERVMRGLTMRGYGPAVREDASVFGIQKSAVRDRFILASGERVEDLRKRDLSKLRLCALLLDGVEYRQEHFVVALGLDKTGAKTVLGFHQGASENQQIGDRLWADLAGRGLDLKQKFPIVIDGGRALRASVKKYCGDSALVQRCQIHKRRNVCEHFADDQRASWDRKLANAYDLLSYSAAKKALGQIHRELMEVNPSAARSLEEGLEETLTLHRLAVPAELRSTNSIESAFSRVRTGCQNVKRWRPGSQRERWIGSALLFAERKFRRIVGYQALPKLMAILDAQTGASKTAGRVA